MVDNNYELMAAMRDHILGSRMTRVVVKTAEFKQGDFADQGTHAPGAITYYDDHRGFMNEVPAHYEPMMQEAQKAAKPVEGESWGTYVPLLLIGAVIGYVLYKNSLNRGPGFFSFGFDLS